MAIFDFIREMNNPDIVFRFNKLYDEHYEGLKSLYLVLYGMNHKPFGKDINFAAKKALVERENLVIGEDNFRKEWKRIGDIKDKVIAYKTLYPRAYLHYCLKLGITPKISRDNITMPCDRKYKTVEFEKRVPLLYRCQDSHNCIDKNFQDLVISAVGLYHRSENPLVADEPRIKISRINTQNNELQSWDSQSPLIPYLKEFEKKEEDIQLLMEREQLWHIIDEEILAKPHCVYLKEYLINKFGTEECTLEDYESIAINLRDFENFAVGFRESYRYRHGEDSTPISNEECDRRRANLLRMKDYKCGGTVMLKRGLETGGYWEKELIRKYRSVLVEFEDELIRTLKWEKEWEDKEQIKKAEEIVRLYPNAASEKRLTCPIMSRVRADNIILMKDELKLIETLSYSSRWWFKHDEKINGIPYKYFFKYHPLSAGTIPGGDEVHRQLIWDFKDARQKAQEIVLSHVVDYLKRLNIDDYFEKITFVCAPASSYESYRNRFALFSKRVCEECRMRDGTPHISILNSVTPRHLGGKESVKYAVDINYLKGRWVIVFDDLVTTGSTISKFISRLSEAGAKVIGIITVGRTV